MHHVNDGVDELRAENEQLKRQLAEARGHSAAPHRAGWPKAAVILLVLVLLMVVTGGFLAGYLPRRYRGETIAAEARADAAILPEVTAVRVESAPPSSEMTLPGSIQAVTEAPILARATGYVKRRLVDIGDRVSADQLLAEIEGPELDQQVLQAAAALEQANASLQQTEATLKQGQSNADLAKITAQRWANLLSRGVVSRQENDNYQAQYAAQQASVEALEKAVGAARSNTHSAEANLARLKQMKLYQAVRAPFAGVITVRNVDSGALVNEGNTLLFRVAQMDRLRVFVNVPQADASSVRQGVPAKLRFPDLPDRAFSGTVTRAANALDPSTRTLLTEIQVANSDGALMPGMYADVSFAVQRKTATAIIPADTLVIRGDGPQVALLDPQKKVHFTTIQLGRDFGSEVEVLRGLEEGQFVVVNPSDKIREGARVKPVVSEEKHRSKH
jgi:RND family efflux transporter MFP subunit